MNCPLCKKEHISEYYADKNRVYYICHNCNLVFVPDTYFLNTEEEKERYDYHRNDINDKNYRSYLYPFFEIVSNILKRNAKGLDFGCGSAPLLAEMFKQAGYETDIYDYFYSKDKTVFNGKFDFITATEVIEHLHDPIKELTRLCFCLNRNGILAVKTKIFQKNKMEFKNWFYIRDLTHVCFYCYQTFQWIANELNLKIIYYKKDIIILRKRI